MANIEHKNITGDDAVHPSAFVASADPGAVGANKHWIDTTAGSGGYVHKIRNAADTGWEVVGIVADIAGVADGDVLTYDNASSTWLPAAPTGGGGGTGQDDDPMAYAAASPSAYDDDFEGTSLDAKWTKNPVVTANTLSISVARGRVIIAPSSYAATARFYGIGQVESGGGSFKIWAKLSSVGGGTDTYNGLFVGVTGGKGHIFGVAVNAPLMLSVMGATTYGEGGSDWSAFDGYNFTSGGPSGGAAFQSYEAHWYRIRWNASTSTLYFDYSLDGDKWINYQSRGSMSQPNRIGLGMYAQSNPAGWASGIDLRVRCFRYEANATL